MHTPLPPATPTDARSTPQHNYGTRIRQNSLIKPSTRLRQSPDPSSSSRKGKSNPAPSTIERTSPVNYPQFPPQGVVLHPDDVNSKVFLAIGRSFLSVDNRAMTIKDLAEMTSNFGLVCQNVSAAGQAITTYIRTHLQRCDTQHDQPLLLRHVLSGTPDDDDLLPALHSRTGGAHCSLKTDNRVTNFRRGTTVWYLSRATSAPCPFARANISLCEYTEQGRVGAQPSLAAKKEVPRARNPETCGQKRKRPLRSCNRLSSQSGDEESDAPEEVQPPPSKVKLVLRLKPLNPKPPIAPPSPANPREPEVIDLSHSSSDSEDSASVASDDSEAEAIIPDQPTESQWSLPPYPRRSISIPCYTPSFDGIGPLFSTQSFREQRRSPSAPTSIPSPPPDSDDEDMEDRDFDLDSDAEFDSDGDTQGESPGPRSPSAPVLQPTAEINVKQEPRDVQDMLDSWDDSLGILRTPPKSISQHIDDELEQIKMEALDIWDWNSSDSVYENVPDWYTPPASMPHQPSVTVKQEEIDPDSTLISAGADTPYSQSSHFEANPGLRPNLRIEGSFPPVSFHTPGQSQVSSGFEREFTSLPQLIPSLSPLTPSTTLTSMLSMLSVQSPTSTTSGPFSPLTPLSELSFPHVEPNPIVIQTCQPCSPPVSATQVEGISVYQMLLGTFRVLRRIDSDFVNISPVAEYFGIALTSCKDFPSSVVITRGSPTINGCWVPLGTARSFVQRLPAARGSFDVFLSDTLFERFPSPLQDFHQSSAHGRSSSHFGPDFSSLTQLPVDFAHSNIVSSDPEIAAFTDCFSEEDLFQQFCCFPETEKSATPAQPEPTLSCLPEEEEEEASPKPGTPPRVLRRSKRVADALASRTRPRTRRSTGRNSVS